MNDNHYAGHNSTQFETVTPCQYLHTMFRKPAFAITLATMLSGCTSTATRHAPALSAPAASAQKTPPGRNVFQDMGDATWRVVSAPARLVTPTKKAKPAAPPTYDAPAAEIIIPTQADSIPVTQPGKP